MAKEYGTIYKLDILGREAIYISSQELAAEVK